MSIDPVSDSAFLRQPETKKGGKSPDETGKKKEFEKEEVLNKILGDDKKRTLLKKKHQKEASEPKPETLKSIPRYDQKGKYIDEIA
jgi:hypothetical protein